MNKNQVAFPTVSWDTFRVEYKMRYLGSRELQLLQWEGVGSQSQVVQGWWGTLWGQQVSGRAGGRQAFSSSSPTPAPHGCSLGDTVPMLLSQRCRNFAKTHCSGSKHKLEFKLGASGWTEHLIFLMSQ